MTRDGPKAKGKEARYSVKLHSPSEGLPRRLTGATAASATATTTTITVGARLAWLLYRKRHRRPQKYLALMGRNLERRTTTNGPKLISGQRAPAAGEHNLECFYIENRGQLAGVEPAESELPLT